MSIAFSLPSFLFREEHYFDRYMNFCLSNRVSSTRMTNFEGSDLYEKVK